MSFVEVRFYRQFDPQVPNKTKNKQLPIFWKNQNNNNNVWYSSNIC